MMGEKEDFSYLEDLTVDIDKELLNWMQTYDMHPLNMAAVVLARLTWLAKTCDMKDDFLRLLESPRAIMELQEYVPAKGELH
jgi:hypothetical protein